MILGGIVIACIAALVMIMLVWTIPWYGIMSGFFVIGWIALWCGVVYDLWRRADISILPKVIWGGVVLLLPLIGLVIYYFARPGPADIRYHGEGAV